MNIAERIKAYYETEDFREIYCSMLMEDTESCQDNIKKFLEENGETPSKDRVWEVYRFILNNLDQFIDTFTNYYVGDNCVDSISFGEQEEQLSIYNTVTKKDYTLPYLRKVFDREGFYVRRNYAYYDMSGSGIMIKFDYEKIPK